MQDYDKIIKQIFFEEVIPECAADNLQIGDWCPAISFNTKIVDKNKIFGNIGCINPKPLLVINNVLEFTQALIEYVKKAMCFYYNDNYSHDNLKKIISLVFANASEHDLVNPTRFLKLQLSFLNWYPKYDFSINFLGYDASVKIEKNKPILESPYSFTVEIKGENNRYLLPNITFGINQDEAIVYAIQNKDKTESTLRKKINRSLYKLNAGYSDDGNAESLLNTKDVTMSFVAIVIIFSKYLKEIGINKLNLCINMPIRQAGHLSSCKRRIDYYNKTMNDQDFVNKKDELLRVEKSYNENISLKLYRTFQRVVEQGDVLKLLSIPFQNRIGLEFRIGDGTFYNDLARNLYEGVEKIRNYNGLKK